MPQVVNKTRKRRAKLSRPISLLILLGAFAAMVANQNRIIDWWRLRDYAAPGVIVALADQASMTDYARHLFYINHPQEASTVKTFRQYCPENQETIVLGCYHPGENGIYLYNVSDISLYGVQQVTAAHEMLHAGYARLSHQDRAKLDAELQSYYQGGLTDPDIKAQIKLYQTAEPDSVMDEMHSLFGTEVANLPPPLESYYKRYFTDRSKVVAYDQQYQGQFAQRQATINSDDKRLAVMKSSIDALEASLRDQLARITANRSRINGYISANDIAQYNAAVPDFNAEIDTYNSGIGKLQATTDAYNQLVSSRNQIAHQLAGLDKALDTRTLRQVSH